MLPAYITIGLTTLLLSFIKKMYINLEYFIHNYW